MSMTESGKALIKSLPASPPFSFHVTDLRTVRVGPQLMGIKGVSPGEPGNFTPVLIISLHKIYKNMEWSQFRCKTVREENFRWANEWHQTQDQTPTVWILFPVSVQKTR